MRPVNLIPPEDRRGDRAPLRRGPMAYVIVGVLAAVLLAVTGIVLSGNQVNDRKDELAALELQADSATAEAGQLAPYIEFATMQVERETTLASLADSRFDWERVLRELALVNPTDVWLTELTGSASGGTAEGTTSSIAPDSGAPSLVIAGCAPTHEAVARFIAALEDIDGVTRVGLSSTERPSATGEASSDGASVTEGCEASGRPASFSATAVFDDAPVAASTDAVTGEAVPATEGQSSTVPPGADNIGTTGEEGSGKGGKKQQSSEALEGAQP